MHPDQVNLLQGTHATKAFSHGNTLPLVTRPWGMVNWTLQTADDPWFFHPAHHTLRGIRATHQPSPWIQDYACFSLMPQTGEMSATAADRASAFDWKSTSLHPARLALELIRYRVHVELTPTTRGAVMRLRQTDRRGPLRLFFDLPFDSAPPSEIRLSEDRRHWRAILRNHHGGVPDHFAMWAVLQFSHQAEKSRADYAEFNLPYGETLTVEIGTSFISEAQAWHNLTAECRSFDLTHHEGVEEWSGLMSRVEVEGGDDSMRRTFASCVYRTMLFPRIWHEQTSTGSYHHRSPFDGQIHDGELYTDNGFWDTHRTLFPWLHLVFPDVAAAIHRGYGNVVREGGWLPQWASPGYRRCMIGTHSDAIIADAVVKEVGGFDLDILYQAMLRHATVPGAPNGEYGRRGLQTWLANGYVASDDETHAACAGTLDYAYDDWCIAQVAGYLNDQPAAARFLASSQHYRKLYDPVTGFFRGKLKNGQWREPWSPIQWGFDYIEGSAWQTLFNVPHDPQGLADCLGGPEALSARLDAMLAAPPHFEHGSYRGEIHEMTEMALGGFGQYAHSNQPSHGALWYYTAAGGQPQKTQHWVRRILTECYNDTPQGFAGDEDNGEMAAWYCFAALGFYPFCPGSPRYISTSPLFDRATLRLPNGRTWTIHAKDQAPDRPFCDRPAWIPHADIVKGGETIVTMRP